MKKLLVLLVVVSFSNCAFAQDIHYGYNAKGDYVPTSVGNERVNYGYNAVGDYVPTSVGNTQIQYGYNAQGDYVPVRYEKKSNNNFFEDDDLF